MAEYYVKTLYDFLGELRENNNREWFKARKPLFDELRSCWIADLGRMIAAMSEWDPALAHTDPRRAAYRIYRDTRFSLDKTPYKTYMSASVTPASRPGAHECGYYIQMGYDADGMSGLYAGIWCPEAPVLARLRHAIVDNIEEWEEIMYDPRLRAEFDVTTTASLKTAPKGWPKNHPAIEWLRMKDFGLCAPKDAGFFLDPAWPEKSAELFRLAKPMVDFINYSINEE